MRKPELKSGEKALANIHLQIPKSYVVLGLLSMALWQGCGKDDPAPTPPPTPKIDHPTEFVLSTNNLPKGVDVNTSNKTITVPPSMSEKDIIALFEQGKVSDIYGDTGIKTVSIQNNKVIITIYGKNGKTGVREEKVIEWKLIISDIVADFPEQISTSPIMAGDTTFISQLFATPIPLNDGTTATPQIQVNGETITNKYIFNKPGKYTLTLNITDSKNTPHSKDYQLTIDPLATKVQDLNIYTPIHQPTETQEAEGWTDKETMEQIGMGEMMHFLRQDIIKPNPTTKPVIVLEQIERAHGSKNHEFLPRTKTLTENIQGIKNASYFVSYGLTEKQTYHLIEEHINKHSKEGGIVLYEDNERGGRRTSIRGINLSPIISTKDNIYVISDPGGDPGNTDANDEIAKPGYGITSIPTALVEKIAPYIFYSTPGTNPDTYWNPDPNRNPLLQSGRELSFGVPAGSHSESTVTASQLIARIITNENNIRQGTDEAIITTRKQVHELLQSLLSKYYHPIYFSYRDTQGDNQMHRTDIQVGRAYNFHSYIKARDFQWNTMLSQLPQDKKIPVFEHADLIDQKKVIFKQDIGLEQDPTTGVWYYSPQKALQQGYNPEEIQKNPDTFFKFVIIDPITRECIFDFSK